MKRKENDRKGKRERGMRHVETENGMKYEESKSFHSRTIIYRENMYASK